MDRVLETGKNQWDVISPQQGFMFQGSWHVNWVLIFHATDSGIVLNKNKGREDFITMFSIADLKQTMQFGVRGQA